MVQRCSQAVYRRPPPPPRPVTAASPLLPVGWGKSRTVGRHGETRYSPGGGREPVPCPGVDAVVRNARGGRAALLGGRRLVLAEAAPTRSDWAGRSRRPTLGRGAGFGHTVARPGQP